MCGICGVIQVRGEPRPVVSEAVLDVMTDALTHRGPNDRGIFHGPGIALGVRRLSIVDVAKGHQPVTSEDGSVVAIQNGELYNHDVLRRGLRAGGHRLYTSCDSEVIPHLYERHGARFPEQLRGKFAIAVWDERRRRAVLARDRLGVKPLYYTIVGDRLVFASELKSLLASGLVPSQLDYEAIDAYLTLDFFPTPATPLRGVSKLPPGHLIVVERDGVAIEPYWTPPVPSLDAIPLSTEDYAERLLAELDESVRLRLMSDVPLGAMLSGGLDSSLVTALMARNMTQPVKTFSVGFAEAGDANELADARLVASALGADHHELELSFAEADIDLEDLSWAIDEPLADLSQLGFFALSRLASEHVVVALSGQGADELLGGYTRHRNAALLGRLERIPRPLRHAAGEAARRRGGRLRRAGEITQATDPAVRQLLLRRSAYLGWRPALVRGPLALLDGRAGVRAVEQHANGLRASPLETTLYLDARLGLVDDMLHYFDRASMAHSLEVRVPFLDHHLVEFCSTIPADLKVRRLTTKYILRRAARGLIPDRIIDKPKIGFFYNSLEAWIDRQLEGRAAEVLLQPEPRYAEFLERRTVEQLIEGVRGREPGSAFLVSSILMLEVWLSSFLPRALGASREPGSADRAREVALPA
jgi:asparagine synthase (glutamine-hydrolysing)